MKTGLSVGLATLCSALAFGQAVSTYTASTDTGIVAKPPLPALGRAGTWIVDPTFKSRVVRATDANTIPGSYLNRSYVSFASSEQNTWNTNSTIFLANMSGWTVPFSFNPATLAVSRMGDLSNSTGGLVLKTLANPCFSLSNPNILYGMTGLSLVQYDFSTNTSTTLLKLDTLVPGAGTRAGDVSVSADEKISVYFGGTAQNKDPYVVVFDKASGNATVLDTLRSTIDGKPASATLGWTIHNSRLDMSGRYVVITSVSGPLTIWDVPAGTLISSPYRGAGHKVGGFGNLINNDSLLGEFGPQWLLRTLDPVGLQQPKNLLPPKTVDPVYPLYNHLSWNNAKPGALLPVLISTYRDYRYVAPPLWLDDEIVALRTDGVEPTVWRFAHHRSVYEGDFWTSPRGNVSQDGRFFVFTSNWEKTLGTSNTGKPRCDVFVVELTPPPIQIGPASAKLSAGQSQQFSVTANSSGLPVTWSISPNVGSISATGLYTAPSSIPANQTVTVTATGTLQGQIARSTVMLLASAGAGFAPIRVNAGGEAYTDAQGRPWSADMGYIYGAKWTGQSFIANTADPTLYQSARYGVLSYRFAVPNGSYVVNLKFAEVTQTAAGKRVFNVLLNGVPVLSNFDIFAQAGGPRIAIEKSFPVTVTDSQVLIQFKSGLAGNPLVNAIEIAEPGALPGGGSSPPFTPIRINAGGPGFTDPQGLVWGPDAGYVGGALWKITEPVTNTDSPALYQTVRYGVGFKYQFGLPSGNYRVKLKFAEVTQTGPGKRVFNVALNGVPILSNFDIYAEAGGPRIALDKVFPVTANAGQIVIQFSSGPANSPMINAIEITQAQ